MAIPYKDTLDWLEVANFQNVFDLTDPDNCPLTCKLTGDKTHMRIDNNWVL
jgi:hypothetical protein